MSALRYITKATTCKAIDALAGATLDAIELGDQ
jgi:hypothetical protein